MSPEPIAISINGEPRRVAAGTTVQQLLEQLRLPARQVALEVNRQLVPRREHAGHQLRDGDALEIVTLVGGG